jgi:hypothetical protein
VIVSIKRVVNCDHGSKNRSINDDDDDDDEDEYASTAYSDQP